MKMRKPLMLTLALALACATAPAQEAPRRAHTRPPYSGPRPNRGKALRPVLPSTAKRQAVHPKPLADHVLAR